MKRHLSLSILTVLFTTTALPATSQTFEDPVIQAVTLFESGLAEVIRETGDEEEVKLRVPMRDVNDILKSLLVRGSGITGAKIVMEGSDPVGDAFSRLPFAPDAVVDTATLLAAVPGLRVTVNDKVTGMIVDVGELCTQDDGCRMMLGILEDDGQQITNIRIGEGGTIKIHDAAVVDGMVNGLAALRAAAGDTLRDITLYLTGDNVSNGQISYVISAPAWKTSYRAITTDTGAVDLQGWAVVENATGEDWSNINLTLSSGSPVTLQANLFDREWKTREDVSDISPEAYEVPRAMVKSVADGIVLGDMAPSAPSPVATIGAGSEMSDSAIESRFVLPGTLDIPAGKILSVPFLAESIAADNLAVWSGSSSQRSGSPDLVLQVRNDLAVRLPAGIVTISDATIGFVGDARMPIVAPGEHVDVTYGTDEHIDVDETTSATEERVSVSVAQGLLKVTGVERRETKYDIVLHRGAERQLMIDHPTSSNWLTEATTLSGETLRGEPHDSEYGARWTRFSVTLPQAGNEESQTSIRVTDSRPTLNTIALGDLDADGFLFWSGAATNDAERAFLTTAARLSGKIHDLQSALTAKREAVDPIERDQARTRENLSAAGVGTPAHNRFMKTLIELEDAIAASRTEQQSIFADLTAAHSELDGHLAAGF